MSSAPSMDSKGGGLGQRPTPSVDSKGGGLPGPLIPDVEDVTLAGLKGPFLDCLVDQSSLL